MRRVEREERGGRGMIGGTEGGMKAMKGEVSREERGEGGGESQREIRGNGQQGSRSSKREGGIHTVRCASVAKVRGIIVMLQTIS